MDAVLADLLQLLKLERIEGNIFRGDSRDNVSAQVFGGQVLGQALSAAHHTVEGRVAHSLHAYFLRRGDVEAPIVYDVDRARDGRSFSVRRVVAIQHGRPIFNLSASFQVPEEGLEHQAEMPEVAPPEELRDSHELASEIVHVLPEKMRRFFTLKRPFEFRPVDPPDFLKPANRPPDDPDLHRNLLAYFSDYELLGTATLPHGLRFGTGNVQMASLDHALWFHRKARVDEWMLYSFDSPNASAGRGYSRGQIFSRDGTLVASTAQEGLVRVWREPLEHKRRSAAAQD